MENCKRLHFDESEGGFYICSLCECPLKVHCYYLHCSLLDNEMICIDCYNNGIEDAGTVKKLKELGIDITGKTDLS